MEGHYFDSIGNELILLDGQWLIISDGEEDSDDDQDYSNDQMDVDEAVHQFEMATAALDRGNRPAAMETAEGWHRPQTQAEIFNHAEPEPQRVADRAPAETEQVLMPWQMADGNVMLDAESVAEPEAASVAGGSQEPEPAMSVDATQAQPEEEIPVEDADDTFECKTCTHRNNVGEMYCSLCGTSNMPTYQATEETKEAEKTTFAQILDIRTENLVMKVPNERGSKWTKSAHYVSTKLKKDLLRRARRMENEDGDRYSTITDMAMDPINRNYVNQWLFDHEWFTLQDICAWDDDLEERQFNMRGWREQYDIPRPIRQACFGGVAVPRQTNVDDRRTVKTRDHPEFAQLQQQLIIQGGRPESQVIPKNPAGRPKPKPKTNRSQPYSVSPDTWSKTPWKTRASGNAWSGDIADDTPPRRYPHTRDSAEPDAMGNATCCMCHHKVRADTIVQCACCDWLMCAACRKRHSAAPSWQADVQWRHSIGGYSSGGSGSGSWDRGSGSQSSKVKKEQRGTATWKTVSRG